MPNKERREAAEAVRQSMRESNRKMAAEYRRQAEVIRKGKWWHRLLGITPDMYLVRILEDTADRYER